MKLTIDLETAIADYDTGTAVAEVLRDEIKAAIKSAVRTVVKAQEKDIQKLVTDTLRISLGADQRKVILATVITDLMEKVR